MEYALRFPFEILSYQALNGGADRSAAGLNYHIDVGEGGVKSRAVTIDPFGSAEEAEAFIQPLWAGFNWALINRGFAPSANLAPVARTKFTDEMPAAAAETGSMTVSTDDLFDSKWPAVYIKQLSHRARFVTALPATLSMGYDPTAVLDLIVKGASFPNASAVLEDDNLRVALDLFAALHTEASRNAQFITLNMALEALAAPRKEAHKAVIPLISRWIKEAKDERKTYEKTSEDWLALSTLIGQISYHKEAAIRLKIRSIVAEAYQNNSLVTEMKKLAMDCYDARSELVHNGSLPSEVLSHYLNELRPLVCQVLRHRFEQLAT